MYTKKVKADEFKLGTYYLAVSSGISTRDLGPFDKVVVKFKGKIPPEIASVKVTIFSFERIYPNPGYIGRNGSEFRDFLEESNEVLTTYNYYELEKVEGETFEAMQNELTGMLNNLMDKI